MQGKLYIGTIGYNTEPVILGELQELSEVIELAADDTDHPVFTKENLFIKADPIEITFEAKINQLALLSILTGKKITNNWLKLHGGVMQRKRWTSG